MKSYLVKTPHLIKLIFRNWVWSFSKKEKALYVTFDDGPTPEVSEWTLNELKKHQAKATFFCIGKNVAQHPKLYQKIIDQGHSIGNHTHNHLNGLKTTTAAYIDNIAKAEVTLQNNKKLFRPPYGKFKRSQAQKLRKKGYKIIMWDVLSADFDTTISPEKCLENVIRYTDNGSIIVFHDSIKARKNLYFTLPKILEYYTEKGYIFKSIS